MRLRVAAVLAALTLSVGLAPAQAPKAAPAEQRQAKLEKMIEDFVKARKEAIEALQKATTDAQRKAAEAKMPREADYLPRIRELINGGPPDDVAAEALFFAVFGLDTQDEKVYEALAKHFVKTDKIRGFVQMALSGAPKRAIPVLEQVLAENPSRELKGIACLTLGSYHLEHDGPDAGKKAEQYFARVAKEFADVKLGPESTLGEVAKGHLYELRHLQVGMPAPAAESKNLKGEKTSLAAYKGKVVILDFWATWCGPCREMIPHERELVDKFKGRPFALISVSADDEKKELEDFLAREPMPWTHWWDGPEAAILKQWNIRFYPTIYVIDARGIIRYKGVQGEALEKAVETLLAEAGKK